MHNVLFDVHKFIEANFEVIFTSTSTKDFFLTCDSAGLFMLHTISRVWRCCSSLPHSSLLSPSLRAMATVPITSTPAAGQLIEHQDKTYETIREGQAYILIPPNTQKHVNPQAKDKSKVDESVKAQSVFYNPIQQFNRDLSVLSIKAFGEDWIARKRAHHDKFREKNQQRRAANKKRKAEASKGEKDGSAKLRKADDGSPQEPAQEVTPAGAVEGGADKSEAVVSQAETNGTASSAPIAVQNGADAKVGPQDAEGASNGQQHATTQPSFRILDALSATGLRALRYAKEIPFVTAVVANDMNPNATKSMALNIEHNDLKSLITPNTANAIGHMYQVAFPPTDSHGPSHINQKYDVIDLDPYGTAAPFIDAALQALNDGGLLCVTCTDAGVFASTGYCEKTYALYGGMPVKGSHAHEGGVRLIINSIASAAARYGLSVEPLLSLNIDFYARVFVRVRKSPADVKFLAGKTMLVYSCDSGCGAWSTNMLGRNVSQAGKNSTFFYKHTIAQAPNADRLCDHCKQKTHIAGPMWGGPIHNRAFIEQVLASLDTADDDVYKTKQRIEGMLTTALDELLVNKNPFADKDDKNPSQKELKEMIPRVPAETLDSHPFFISLSALSKVLHCIAPSDASVKGALRHLGYTVTRSHCQPGSIKTDAPWSVIWEVMREWVRQKQPIKEGALKEGTAGWHIMQNARKIEESEPVTENGNGQEADAATPEIITDGAAKVKKPSGEAKRIDVVFDEALGRESKPEKGAKRLVRYQMNPRENWGPMTKAKGSG